MFSEIASRIGRLFFSKMRPLFFFSLLNVPVLLALFFLWIQSMQLEDMQSRFEAACKKGRIAMERKKAKEQFLRRYSHADRYFLQEQLESLHFLEKEKNELQALVDHPAFSDKEMAKERLLFLCGKENRLSFVEEAIRTSSNAKETEERGRDPVEMDDEDIKKFLSWTEDVVFGTHAPLENSPQILITDFSMTKKERPLSGSSFQVEMNLLTREFSQ